jgi:hypothetical protein
MAGNKSSGPGKGKTNNPNGRPAGVPNKATRDIKEAYRLLIEKNLDNLTGWLEKIADKDPEKAIRILNDLSEYVIPKLARKEFTGEDGKPLFPKITIEIIDNATQVKPDESK